MSTGLRCQAGRPQHQHKDKLRLAVGAVVAVLMALSTLPLGGSSAFAAAAQEPGPGAAEVNPPGPDGGVGAGDPGTNGDPDDAADGDDADGDGADDGDVDPVEAARPAIRDAVKRLDAAAASVDSLQRRRDDLAVDVEAQRRLVNRLAGNKLPRAEDRLRRSEAQLESLRGELARARLVRDALEEQARKVALNLYVTGPVEHLDFAVATNHAGALERLWSSETVRQGVGSAHDTLRLQASRLERLEGAVARRESDEQRHRRQVTELATRLDDAEAELARLEDRRGGAETAIGMRQGEIAAAQEEVLALLASVGLPAYRAADPGLGVMGPSALSGGQLAAWFADYSSAGGIDPRIARLADLYVAEGEALGVRGDVAFVQAVIETGGFRFTGSHNYAGIGHCDACPRGYAFASERDGVRAQVQLLRGYADADVTPDDLPGGPVAPINVGSLGVRGCCGSWWGLSGVWASALHYGGTIHNLYEQALAHAAARPVG